MWFIWDTDDMFMLLSAWRMCWLGIDGHTLEITMRFAGFISLRISISCPSIFIVLVLAISDSSTILLAKNTQNLLFEVLDINRIFFD